MNFRCDIEKKEFEYCLAGTSILDLLLNLSEEHPDKYADLPQHFIQHLCSSCLVDHP